MWITRRNCPRWKNPLGYDKGQITLFGFSHNSLLYEIHVKILCNSKEKKCSCGHPSAVSTGGSVPTPATRASHTHTNSLFHCRRTKPLQSPGSQTQLQVRTAALHRTRVEQLWGSTGTHRWPEARKHPKTWLGDSNPPLSLPDALREVKSW